MKYRRKPVTVEAIVWDGTNDAEVREFVGAFVPSASGLWAFLFREGTHGPWPTVFPGDAIVKDPDDGFSVVSAVVFAREYEGAE